MEKQQDLKQWGQAKTSFELKVREWYQVKDALIIALNEKRIRIKRDQERLQSLNGEMNCDLDLIKKIEEMLYDFKDAEREKLNPQPKWVQRQAKKPLPGSFGCAFK